MGCHEPFRWLVVRYQRQSRTTARFDVFLIHRHRDGPSAYDLAQRLRTKGIEPWIDREQVVPGEWFQEALQAALARASCAAILIGRSTPAGWQGAEIMVAISACIRRNIRVIPVLLPGVRRIPRSLRFLQEMHWVQFEQSIAEPEAMRALVRGISAACLGRRRLRARNEVRHGNRKRTSVRSH
jgi:hypothetical protein